MVLRSQDDPDTLSYLLMAQLALADIEAIEASRKSKTRAGLPLSDEDVAFKIQADGIRQLLSHYPAARIRPDNAALENDQAKLETSAERERGEQDDRSAASQGQPLPAPTMLRRMFARLGSSPSGSLNLDDNTNAIVSTSAHSVASGSSSSLTPTHNGPDSKTGFIGQPQECVICMDTVQSPRFFVASCDHAYCRDCLVNLVERAILEESLYPLGCCKQPLLVDAVLRHLSPQLASRFLLKATEFDTPSVNRLYCHKVTCSAFLGSTVNAPPEIDCKRCKSLTCTSCKSEAHKGEDCAQNAALIKLKQLALEQHWQPCPGCHAIVELHQGCYHMTCRCRTQFCYLCAAPWKTCSCVQWDENRIVNGEPQAVNVFGVRARVHEPAAYQQRVRA